MAAAKSGDTVKVHYTGKLEDGTVFDTSKERDPLEFTLGKQQVIPGFEEGIVGMNPGETKTVSMGADKAYGPKREDLIAEVPRDKLPSDMKPEVGQRLQVQQQDGQKIPIVITAVNETAITIDANHPLAGEDLTFEIQLLEII